MLSRDSMSHSKFYKVMTEQQFEQVVSAILDGKYSWACMLILEFAGYNPLYYIPRRTYTRLKKEHNRKDIKHIHEDSCVSSEGNISESSTSESQKPCHYKTQIRDLAYLEGAEHHVQKSHGRGIDISDTSWTEIDQEFDKVKQLYLQTTNLMSAELW